MLVLALVTLLPGVAAAGAGRLAAGDAQLGSGEFYDRVTFEGAAGDEVVIELTSTAFDPYLIVLGPDEGVLIEEDDSPGAGLGVRVTLRLPTAGRYTAVVTSAYAAETGAYRLTIGAPDTAAAPPVGKTPIAPPATQAPTRSPSSPPSTTPGTVTGTVVDTAGRPIAGARVWIQPALTTGLVEVRTDAEGRYLASSLIDVPYTAKAWTLVEYGGRTLCLRLGMESAVDYDAFVPSHGAVRNFRWQLTGPIEDLRSLGEHFGGMLRVMNTNAFSATGQHIELSFTSTGPRIDGSTVAPFTRSLDPSAETDVHDLPVGPYTVTATLVTSDGARRPLRLGPDIFDTDHDTLAIDWTGDGSCTNSNGLGWAYAWLHVPE